MAIDYDKYLYSTGTRYISNCGSDENGGYSGGKAGDQTGNEWVLKAWYNRPWDVVLRYPDQNVALLFAELAIEAALNDNIGYDQNQRDTFWTELQKVGYRPSKITTACEADCSSGVIAIIKAVGYLMGIAALQNITATYTGNMKSSLVSAGFEALTASKYTGGSEYLLPGDVNLNESHHTAFSVTVGSNATFNPSDSTDSGTSDGAMNESADPQTVWDYLYSKIGNTFGVAGLMGNLYAESALIPINLENAYESKLGYTDKTYTMAVDSGSYAKFVSDSAGYGLAQWTYSTRKASLLSYAQTKATSIGNLEMQLAFLWNELKSDFPSVLSTLKSATSVKEASDKVLVDFENPSDKSDSVKTTRASYGQQYYDKYASGSTTSTESKSIDELAQEVIDGKWGNDSERTEKLTAAGYDAAAVQALVNEKMGASTSTANLPTYNVGTNYTVQVDGLYVRKGAGTNYAKKLYSDLTSNAKSHASKDSDGYGMLNKGTTVTCQATKVVGNEVWMQIPSGWIAAYYSNKKYVA